MFSKIVILTAFLSAQIESLRKETVYAVTFGDKTLCAVVDTLSMDCDETIASAKALHVWISRADSNTGRYTLLVREASENGKIYSLSVRVKPPFYRTGAAFVLYGILALSFIAGIILFYLRRIGAGRDRERMEFFTNVSGADAEKTVRMVSDQVLMERTVKIIRDNFRNPEFNINRLSVELGMGRSKLYAKIKKITGLTPNKLIVGLKLQEAAALLDGKTHLNVSEIAFELGFSSTKYFTKCFKAYYGVVPQDWRKK